MGAHISAVLERHPVRVGELKIGDAFGGLRGAPDGLGEARLVQRGETLELGAAARRDVSRCFVGAKEPRFIVVVERHEGRKPPRDPRMTGERLMLRLREADPLPQLQQRGRERGAADPIERQCRGGEWHRIAVYPPELTAP